jgi:hypothetical protein
MAIDFVPVFNIKVTPEDVAAYYKSIGVTDYPKNANGMPKMNSNRTVCKFIFEQKEKQMKEEYGEVIEQRRKEKIAEACSFRIDTSRNEDCPICMEPMQGRSILNCSHAFCINCSIQHFRTKQNCPLCRAEVCGPAVKAEVTPLPDQTVATIVEDNMSYVYPERHNLDLYNFILTSATIFRENNKANVYHFTNDIFDEVRKFAVDVANDVKSWYED